MIKTKVIGEITVEPLTTKRWTDFESLFCSAAIPGHCWCVWWRTTQKEAVANRGEGNKAAMSEKVDAGELVGLLAYIDGAAVGWCSVGPREAYSRIGRSPALTPVDGQEPPPSTWSTVCFFVHRDRRKQRVAHELLAAAVAFAAAHGATAFEGYPARHDRGCSRGLKPACLQQRSGDVVGEIAEPVRGAAQMLEPSVDGLRRVVGLPGRSK